MTNSVRDAVTQLEDLYKLSVKAVEELNRTLNAVDISYFPGLINVGPFGQDMRPQRKADFDYDKFEQDVNEITEKWVDKVMTILKNDVQQVRFRLQFEDPKVSYIHGINHRDDKQLDKIEKVIDNFGDKVTALREIVIQLEESSEVAQRPPDDNIEPASYDPKTKTIFFADEAVRFNKGSRYGPAICELMFAKKPDKKIWQLKDFQQLWDSLYDYVGLQKPSDWQRVHDVILKLNARIAKRTNVDNLFLLSTKSVRLNQKYIAKKQP